MAEPTPPVGPSAATAPLAVESRSNVSRTQHRRTAVVIAIPILFLLSLVGWAYASPVGSSPDDTMHLASSWCGLGERDGLCEAATDDPKTLLVPQSLLTSPCFAFNAEASGSCWVAEDDSMAEPTQINTTGAYPPLFYAAMSLFASADIQASVIAMRIFNAFLAVGAFTAVFWASPARTRAAIVVSVGATIVPLGLFIVPSTNPSSWAYISAAVVWAASYGAFNSAGRRAWVLWGLAVLGAVIGAGARADSAAYAVLAFALAAAVSARRGANLLHAAVAGVIILGVSAAFYLTSSQSSAVTEGFGGSNPPLTRTELLLNLLEIPGLWTGALGGWGLGWLDTPMPAVVTVSCSAVAFGAVFIGARMLEWRRASALAVALVALWAVPFIVLYQSRAIVGEQVQPRYLLPLLLILVGVASAHPRITDWWSGTRLLIAATALTVAGAVALHVNLRRYVTGLDDRALNPGDGAEWWWPVAPAPLAVWLGTSLAFALTLAGLWWLRRRGTAEMDVSDSGSVIR